MALVLALLSLFGILTSPALAASSGGGGRAPTRVMRLHTQEVQGSENSDLLGVDDFSQAELLAEENWSSVASVWPPGEDPDTLAFKREIVDQERALAELEELWDARGLSQLKRQWMDAVDRSQQELRLASVWERPTEPDQKERLFRQLSLLESDRLETQIKNLKYELQGKYALLLLLTQAGTRRKTALTTLAKVERLAARDPWIAVHPDLRQSWAALQRKIDEARAVYCQILSRGAGWIKRAEHEDLGLADLSRLYKDFIAQRRAVQARTGQLLHRLRRFALGKNALAQQLAKWGEPALLHLALQLNPLFEAMQSTGLISPRQSLAEIESLSHEISGYLRSRSPEAATDGLSPAMQKKIQRAFLLAVTLSERPSEEERFPPQKRRLSEGAALVQLASVLFGVIGPPVGILYGWSQDSSFALWGGLLGIGYLPARYYLPRMPDVLRRMQWSRRAEKEKAALKDGCALLLQSLPQIAEADLNLNYPAELITDSKL